MCVAIYKPAKKTISKAVLEACALQNPDGCGMAYISNDGQLIVERVMKFDDFYPAYQQAFKDNKESPFLIHFRIATKGTVNLENCHPFRIDENHVFIHNGTIIPVPCGKQQDKSDTRMFNETVLRLLPEGWMRNAGITRLIEDFVGQSKIVVMDRTGDVVIYNQEAGSWEEGVWFSNNRHKWRLHKGQGYKDAYEWKNIRRRWLGGICEAFDPHQNKWRVYDAATQKLKDTGLPVETVLDKPEKKEVADKDGELCHECFYCRIYHPQSEMGVYMVEGYRTIACKDCVSEVRSWGVEIFQVVGGYLGKGRLLAHAAN